MCPKHRVWSIVNGHFSTASETVTEKKLPTRIPAQKYRHYAVTTKAGSASDVTF